MKENGVGIIFDLVIEEELKSVCNQFDAYKLKHILTRIIEDACSKEWSLDKAYKKEIKIIEEHKIQPHLPVEELKRTLFPILRKYIIGYEELMIDRIASWVCYEYKIRVAGLITSAHVNENVLKVQEAVDTSNRRISELQDAIKHILENNKDLAEKTRRILQESIETPLKPLHFIEELINVRMYHFIAIQLFEDSLFENELEEIFDNIGRQVTIEYYMQDGSEWAMVVFWKPINECTLKECLEGLGEELCNRDIGIMSVMSHVS